MAGEPNDVSYKNNKHIAGISIHYFPKDIAVSSQFFMSQRCNMIVLAARLMGTLFWPPNRTFNAKKNGQGEFARHLDRLFLTRQIRGR